MAYKSLCNECIFKSLCENNTIKGCPCKECLVKMICANTCKEAGTFFRKAMIILKKRSKSKIKINKGIT